jgi:hypothetical protein
VKPYNIRTTVIAPGAVATELPTSTTDPDVAERLQKFYEEIAIPAESFARAVAFAMSQPEDVDVNEILFRPTRQELEATPGLPFKGESTIRVGIPRWRRPGLVEGGTAQQPQHNSVFRLRKS